jgi:hypothetical protein
VTVTANPGDTRLLAIVYPRDYLANNVGVGGGLLRLWRRDRDLAQAVLLHELAHHRQGETFFFGFGAPLERLVRAWPLVLLAMVAGMTVAAVGGILNMYLTDAAISSNVAEGAQAAGLDITAFPIQQATSLWDRIWITIRLNLSILPLQLISISFKTLAAFIFPLATIWIAEFNADRFAVRLLPAGASVPVDLLGSGGTWRRRFLDRLSHPPNSLRRWFALRATSPWTLFILLLLWPGSALLLFVTQVVAHVPNQLISQISPETLGFDVSGLGAAVVGWAEMAFEAQAPYLATHAVIMTVWLGFRTLRGARPSRGEVLAYLGAAGVTAAVALLGGLARTSATG